jgi:hypothetical protein
MQNIHVHVLISICYIRVCMRDSRKKTKAHARSHATRTPHCMYIYHTVLQAPTNLIAHCKSMLIH